MCFMYSIEYRIRKCSYIFFSACFQKELMVYLKKIKNLMISTHFSLTYISFR